MDYGNLKVPENVTPEVQAILDSYEARNKEIENAHRKEMAKQYGGAALQIGSAFIPGTLGLKGAGLAIKALTPRLGQKIAENAVTGVTSSLASGAVEGLGRGLMEGENPLKTMLSDTAISALFGGTLGVAGAKIGKKLAEKKLQNGNIAPQKYFDDYVAGLANNSTLGKQSPFSKELNKFKDLRDGYTPVNKQSQIIFDSPDDFVENMKNFDISNYSKDEYKQLRKQAKKFYKNNLSPNTASVGDVNVLFTDLGLDEQLSKGLHNVDVFTDLINQIETGNLHPELVNNKPNDKRLFHIVNNKFKDKNMEYQLLNDKNVDKFYFAKDITNKKELPQIGRNQNTTYEEVPTNSITNNLDNFNPSAGLYEKIVDNYNPEIEQLAKDYFGLTDNVKEAGYILNDGSLLDLSGKKFGGPANTRSMDHREIVDAFLDNPNNTNNLEIGFDEFIDNGAVRYMPENNTFFLSKMPSEQQVQKIKELLDLENGKTSIELVPKVSEWGWDNNFKRDYNLWSDPQKIIDDIRTYFKGGKPSDFRNYD